jgi:hypothetical protein
MLGVEGGMLGVPLPCHAAVRRRRAGRTGCPHRTAAPFGGNGFVNAQINSAGFNREMRKFAKEIEVVIFAYKRGIRG